LKLNELKNDSDKQVAAVLCGLASYCLHQGFQPFSLLESVDLI